MEELTLGVQSGSALNRHRADLPITPEERGRSDYEAAAGIKPRLTTGEVIMTTAQVGGLIHKLAESFEAIPALNNNGQIKDALENLIEFAGAIQVKAKRLLESNR